MMRNENAPLLAAILLLGSLSIASAEGPCASTLPVPPVLISVGQDNNLGQLAIAVGRSGFRVFKDGCYVFPQAFAQSTLSFRAFFVPDAADTEDGFSDYLGVKLIRLLKADGNRDQVKAYRNAGWYRTTDGGARVTLEKTRDEAVPGGIEAWNELHARSELAWADSDEVIGLPWHAQLGDSRSANTLTYAGLWITRIPNLGDQYRHIISNQLIRFSASSYLVPFKGKVFDGTEFIIVRYHFGQDPNVHQVVLCRRSCT